MTEAHDADQDDLELEADADEPDSGPGLGAEPERASHLDEQLGDDDLGVDEALQAWREGGHATDALDESDEIQAVQLPQLDPGAPPSRSAASESGCQRSRRSLVTRCSPGTT